ncbi:MAG: MerR family transcriptional regulator [Ruminococcus sp.]|nr:MerR family transcriptional regulator [Ruminococcus sp.]
MGEVRYMISEAAKKVQVESHVLRYWEEELGLEIGRTDMGHRYYTEDDIQLFLCIQKLKNEGMLLRDLKPMIPELTATRKRLNAARSEKEAQSAAKARVKTDAVSDQSGDSSDKTEAISGQTGMASDKGGTIPVKSSQTDAYSGEDPETDLPNPVTADTTKEASVSTKLASPDTEVIQMTQLEQVRSLIGDVLTDVVSANNETLKKDISRKVTADVIREMDFLFQANERREEEHYRKLDMLIRQQQAHRKEAMRETPIGKLKKLLT